MEVGGEAQVKQAVREGRAGVGLETLGQDLRYAIRKLGREMSFTAIVVLILGLGIVSAASVVLLALLERARPDPLFPGRLFACSMLNPLPTSSGPAGPSLWAGCSCSALVARACRRALTGPSSPSLPASWICTVTSPELAWGAIAGFHPAC